MYRMIATTVVVFCLSLVKITLYSFHLNPQGRMRAAQRIRENNREKERKAIQNNINLKNKQDQKWILRDKKVS